MSVINGAAMALVGFSGLATIGAAIRFHQLIRSIRTDSYHEQSVGRGWTVLIKSTMLLMTAGHVAKFSELSVNGVNLVDAFMIAAFLVYAATIHGMVWILRFMEDDIFRKRRDILRTFVSAIEMKDVYTKGHSEHVYNIVRLFCKQLKQMRAAACDRKLQDAALLHDIGKIGVDERILDKPGELTDEEWASVRSHPVVGSRLLDDTCFAPLAPWVLYHHEHVDGQGYMKLKGDEIPFESRIIAIADTYSALTTNRAYRKALTHEEAIEIMRHVAGTQLDAKLFSCFVMIKPDALKRCAVDQTDRA